MRASRHPTMSDKFGEMDSRYVNAANCVVEGSLSINARDGAAFEVRSVDTTTFKIDTIIRHLQGPNGAQLVLFSDPNYAFSTVALDGANGNATFVGTLSAERVMVAGVPLVARPTLTLGPFGFSDAPVGASVEGRVSFPMSFAAKDTATSEHVNAAGSLSNRIRMPADGRVVGWSLVSNTARTAGAAELTLGINGVAQVAPPAAMVCRLDAESRVSRLIYAPTHEDGLRFYAGQELGVFLVTSADWAPVTSDFTATMAISFD